MQRHKDVDRKALDYLLIWVMVFLARVYSKTRNNNHPLHGSRTIINNTNELLKLEIFKFSPNNEELT